MDARYEDRKALIDRMLEARTEWEVEAAEKAADAWLKYNPGDTRVIAAEERLAEKGAKLRDPECRVDRATLVVFVVLFLPATLALSIIMGDWLVASAMSFITVGPVAEFVGGLLYDSSGDNTRRHGGR